MPGIVALGIGHGLPTNCARRFDQWLWPHVSRKAALIETMLQTSSNLYQKVEDRLFRSTKATRTYPWLPSRTRDGLIVGKMDHHRPVLFVNAISYRGLVEHPNWPIDSVTSMTHATGH